MIAEIRGTGAYIPAETLDNHELSRLVETSDEWIRERTGIAKRHIAVRDTTSSMAAGAAAMALESAGLSPKELDLILVSTISPDRIMPGVACMVQKELCAENALCFDLNAACSGFVLAYQTACAYLESGFARNALIVGSECLSNLTNWQDRTTCILFGDGAGAAVLSAAEGRCFQPAAGSDGALGEALTLKSQHDHSIFSPEESRHDGENFFMEMDGQAVFRFAVKQVPQAIEEVLEKNACRKEDVRFYLLHQANRRIVEAAARRLSEPLEKFPMNLQEYGNTSSASIPILLHELRVSGQLHSGDLLVLAGFGGGLTWGASLLRWQ